MADTPRFTRRTLIAKSPAPFILPTVLRAAAANPNAFARVVGMPDSVTAHAESGAIRLQRNGSQWEGQDVEVGTVSQAAQLAINLRSPQTALMRIHLRWQLSPAANLQYLGDHWERSYGDLAWRHLEPERVMPWYFLATDGPVTHACGVKTAPAAFCFWQVDSSGTSLWLDVRNGGGGVKLGRRELSVATVIAESYTGVTPFSAAKRFCARLCEKPRLPAQPVYGGNNWYYAYGESSAEDIRGDSERIVSWTSSKNKPFMVIDDGWEPNRLAGPWARGNNKFPDMAHLAAQMRAIGVQPGLWVRPLFTKEQVPAAWQLKTSNAAKEYSAHEAFTLDPTVPEVLEKIRSDIQTVAGWGYQLIKHDFSTYDLLGRWGFSMVAEITEEGWKFADQTRTNAEVILTLYRALREGAGEATLLGCNTIGHLGAGLFELQRIGDDTSGRDWNRTRKMGVNTLAFRAAQHNTFFAVDADCVGLTKQVAWAQNRQWLDLVARSGTPLFVSAAPDAVGPEQRKALQDAFRLAAEVRPVGEPLDWLTNSEPERWSFGGQTATYDWFGNQGTSPFAG